MAQSFDFDLGGLHLAICIPAYDGKIPTDQMVSLINTMTLARAHGVIVSLELRVGSALIEKARAELLNKVLFHSEATHLLMLDSDIAWEPEAVIRLLSFCTTLDAVCGPYQTKEEDPDFHYALEASPDGRVVQNAYGLLKLKTAPLGFNCFRADALRRMCEDYGKDLYFIPKRGEFKDTPIVSLFSTELAPDDDGIQRYWGEDIAFYRRLAKSGIDAWLDPTIKLKHIGSKVYSGAYMDWVKAKNAEALRQSVSEAA